MAIICGHTVLGKNVFVGAAAAIREDLTIGKNAIISMGAVVLKDVKENMVVMGNPARTIAENKSEKVFG